MADFRKLAIGMGLLLAIAWVSGAGRAQIIPEDYPFRSWTSANGQYAIKVVETISIINGVPSHLDQETLITATAKSPEDRTSEQWKWSSHGFPVANALLADSGKLVVLVKTFDSTPLRIDGEVYATAREIVILDDQGKQLASIANGPWWKALGDDGAVSRDHPPKLRLLDKDKTIEITLASGKIVRINTDSGELTVVKGTATAPAPAPAAETTRAQAAGLEPIVRPANDPRTQEQAHAHGLSKANWMAQLKINPGVMRIVGPTLVCGQQLPGISERLLGTCAVEVVDLQTGHLLWEMKAPAESPMDWTEEGLIHTVADAPGKLSLWRSSADTPEGKVLWETRYDPAAGPITDSASFILATPSLADQQIITGERVMRMEDGGYAASPIARPLTIRSFDRKSGRLQWATPVPGVAVSATVTEVAEGMVNILVMEAPAPSGSAGPASVMKPRGGFVMGLNVADGKIIWKSPSSVRSIDAAVHGSLLVALAENGEVLAYDRQTGKEQWRTAISMDGDRAKSKIGMLNSLSDRVYLDSEGVLATVTGIGDMTSPTASQAFRNSKEGGIALLDPQTGRQTGYFNDKLISTVAGNSIRSLQVHGNLLIAQIGTQGCIGVNRKTQRLEWYIPASASVTAAGVLYLNTARQNVAAAHNATTAVILAVPLDAPH